MTERERNLLIILGTALFVIGNFIAFNSYYLPEKQKAERAKQTAENDFKVKEMTLASAGEIEQDIAWLERTNEAPSTPQEAQSKLQSLLRNQAAARNLEVRDTRILPYQPGQFFSRVRILFRVAGMERDVYSWLTSAHQVNQRQVITKMEMKPQGNDLTRIECEVEIEKWITTPEEL